PFDAIMSETRVVLCKEPASHAAVQADFRGLPYLLFNGTIASPPGHPFWAHLLSMMPGLAAAKDVLDATGPCLLTSAQRGYSDQAAFAIHPSALFVPVTSAGSTERDAGDD
ncbi:glycosyl transferase, partial [Mesorhizobium sp. M2D.F.Ca.ET.145.01.1.1]